MKSAEEIGRTGPQALARKPATGGSRTTQRNGQGPIRARATEFYKLYARLIPVGTSVAARMLQLSALSCLHSARSRVSS
jgi:hypothetical protein